MAIAEPRLRVLYISAHLPYPPWSGGRRRELEFIQRLSSRVDFTLCVSSRTYEQDQRHRRAVLPYVETLRIAQADRRNRCSGLPRQVLEKVSIPLARRVEQLLREERFDVVHVEGYYLLDHLPQHVDVPILLVEHNVEYELLLQMAEFACDPDSRALLLADANATRHHEQQAWRRVDACGFVSSEDCAAASEVLGYSPWLLPHGGDHLIRPTSRGDAVDGGARPCDDEYEILFVGNFSYAPSADAAGVLVRDVLHDISRALGSVHVALVGPGLSDDLRAAAASDDRITLTGAVAELERWFRRCSLFVAPLRIGGGTRFKLLEAMAASCAIVTTPIGARGIPGAPDAMRVAETSQVAEAAVDLLGNHEARAQLKRKARLIFESLPTWDECAELLHQAYLVLSGHDADSLDRAPCRSSATTTLIPSE